MYTKVNTDTDSKLKPWHFVAGTALSCVPIVGEIGDTAIEMHNIKKLENMPIKDTFIKAIENKGKSLQKYNIVKDFAPKKLGAAWFAFWTLGDIIIGGLIVKALADWFSKK